MIICTVLLLHFSSSDFQHHSFAEAVELAIRQLLSSTLQTKDALQTIQETTKLTGDEILRELLQIQSVAELQSSELRNQTFLFAQSLSNQKSMLDSQSELQHQQKALQRTLLAFNSEFQDLFRQLSALQTQAQEAEKHISQISGDIGKLLDLQNSTISALLNITSSGFYLLSFCAVMLSTALWKRAQNARLPLILQILIWVALERYFLPISFASTVSQTMPTGGDTTFLRDEEGNNVGILSNFFFCEEFVLRTFRRAFLCTAAGIFFYFVYHFEDSTHRLLDGGLRNMELLREILARLDGFGTSAFQHHPSSPPAVVRLKKLRMQSDLHYLSSSDAESFDGAGEGEGMSPLHHFSPRQRSRKKKMAADTRDDLISDDEAPQIEGRPNPRKTSQR